MTQNTLSQEPGVQPATDYAGDISPELAWTWLQAGRALLVDVRTPAEITWVGTVPGSVAVPLKTWPGMALNPDFDAHIEQLGKKDKPLLMLCRSGVRSVIAAERAAELGLEAYNILEGFEGGLDANSQRGHVDGWRKRGLPWQ